jgi:hypothetical protein
MNEDWKATGARFLMHGRAERIVMVLLLAAAGYIGKLFVDRHFAHLDKVDAAIAETAKAMQTLAASHETGVQAATEMLAEVKRCCQVAKR